MQEGVHQGTHFVVKGREVLGIAIKAALRTEVVKWRSIEEEEEKLEEGRSIVEREAKVSQLASLKRQQGGARARNIGGRREKGGEMITAGIMIKNSPVKV